MSSVEAGIANSSVLDHRYQHLQRGSVNYKRPIETIIRNGKPALASKKNSSKSPRPPEQKGTSKIENLETITKRNNYNDQNILLSIEDQWIRKSVALGSINAINSLIEDSKVVKKKPSKVKVERTTTRLLSPGTPLQCLAVPPQYMQTPNIQYRLKSSQL